METEPRSSTESYTTPEGRRRVVHRNEFGQVDGIEWFGGAVAAVQLGYDELGRLSGIVQGSGAERRRYAIGYDGNGYLSWIEDPLGRRVEFERDAAGRVLLQRLADGREVLFGYDAAGNIVSVKPPGRPEHRFEYDGFGELGSFGSDFGGSALYSYVLQRDAAGRIVGKTETIQGERQYPFDEPRGWHDGLRCLPLGA